MARMAQEEEYAHGTVAESDCGEVKGY